MKEQLPAPDFDANNYSRPTQDWVCGRAAEGCPCRIGPDANGRCRATSECTPALDLKEGETKGRYRCTRPAEYGGACENGPLPDGRCCRSIPRCQPVRSLRSKRKLFTLATVMATMGMLLLAVGGDYRWKFINPGKLSVQHSSASFSQAYLKLHLGPLVHGDEGCAACHATAHAGPMAWVRSAAQANPGPLHRRTLALTTVADMTSIDQACQRCHLAHTFHEPNTVRDHSCSACHQEHIGGGFLKKPDDANCATCHANAEVMCASADKGKRLTTAAFNFHLLHGKQVFHAPRPEGGYTQIIHAFATDHPEFQVVAQRLKDPDTLKFNHRLHLSSQTVPQMNGRGLECADCHKPDVAGTYYQKVSFDENCRKCHSLQFDARNPDLGLPHGNSEFVRAFLRSLPAQYAEYGARKKGLKNQAELDDFVKEQMLHIREQTLSGEDLEQEVFFSDAKLGPTGGLGQIDARGRARFPGCAYCHEVKAIVGGAPSVTPPVVMERWLLRGSFNHSKHALIACTKCHDAERSSQTADVLLPSKSTCVECHSPKGGVASGCSICHSYHAPVNVMAMSR